MSPAREPDTVTADYVKQAQLIYRNYTRNDGAAVNTQRLLLRQLGAAVLMEHKARDRRRMNAPGECLVRLMLKGVGGGGIWRVTERQTDGAQSRRRINGTVTRTYGD